MSRNRSDQTIYFSIDATKFSGGVGPIRRESKSFPTSFCSSPSLCRQHSHNLPTIKDTLVFDFQHAYHPNPYFLDFCTLCSHFSYEHLTTTFLQEAGWFNCRCLWLPGRSLRDQGSDDPTDARCPASALLIPKQGQGETNGYECETGTCVRVTRDNGSPLSNFAKFLCRTC
jgi:hypothetical protein